MISVPVIKLKGEAEKANLPEKLFGVKVKHQILAQAVRVFLSNQRVARAKTKTRAEVAKTTAKMFRQKGTGRARHGSYAAPIFVGGGISHGPSGEQNYTLKMPAAMRRLALLGSLSEKAAKKTVQILREEKSSGKTKEAVELAKKAEIAGKKVLVVVGKDEQGAARAWRNLDRVTVSLVQDLNPYIILNNKELLFTEKALKEAEERYAI
jgi:large subunit ribosomal protein L4